MRRILSYPGSVARNYNATMTTTPPRLVDKARYGPDRYYRSPAERMLLRWVFCWLLMSVVVTVVMLFILFKVNQYHVIDAETKAMLQVQHALTREAYSSKDYVSKSIIKNIKSENIRDVLKKLTAAPSSDGAGRNRLRHLLRVVKEYWSHHGMDSTELTSYKVLLSIPDPKRKNKVSMYSGDQLLLAAATEEVPAHGSHVASSPAYYAYAAAGDVKENVLYVNYGQQRDYDYLAANYVEVLGKVCVARLGQIPMAKKVELAEKAGAAALVLFLDPGEVEPRTYEERPFPDSWWVGGSALQRGSVAYVQGDPITPGYPSSDGMHRIPVQNAKLPKIPCHPIGYDDARSVFRELKNLECPPQWVPKLDVPCYIEGPRDIRLRVVVHNHLRQNGEVTNLVGSIRGREEPDRLVIVGNHLDPLSMGSASDPLLGVSQLLEVTRVLGRLVKGGWRPRRTLMFTLWDGEELGMLGSTEWVEDHMAILRTRAVVYITTELLTGDSFQPMASPTLSRSIRLAASIVPYYKNKSMTLLKAWSDDQEAILGTRKNPVAKRTVGRTDDAPFVFSAGVPTAFLQFTHRYYGINLYPAYHTAYDSYEMVAKLIDPSFEISRMAAQATASLARLWADRKLLLYNLRDLAYHLKEGIGRFIAIHKRKIVEYHLDLRALQKAAAVFADMADSFTNWTRTMDTYNPIMIRIANDNMMKVEKIFISPRGLPTRDSTLRNLMFSPEGVLFQGLQDSVTQQPFDKTAFGLQAALLAEALCQAAGYLTISPIWMA